MFKKTLNAGLVLIVTTAVAVSLYNAVLARPVQAAGAISDSGLAQTASKLASQAGSAFSGSYGQGGGNSGGVQGYGQGRWQALPPASDLSESEAQGLLYMIEEEKLARDVYQAMYQRWSLPEFQNISQSEQTHMNAVQQLLDRYSLSSPVQPAPGSFTDPGLQSLYTELVARGSQSLVEAIKVGGLIEEIDILDLQSSLAQTDNTDIQQVYNNLLNGSFNHLRAFANTFRVQTGENYQPQKLPAAAYQAILNGSQGGNGRGNGGGQGGGRGNGRRQGQGGA